jgi:hypothetical protein
MNITVGKFNDGSYPYKTLVSVRTIKVLYFKSNNRVLGFSFFKQNTTVALHVFNRSIVLMLRSKNV